ncbi:MAG: hypothetical protein HY708_02750 [Ignavibacteriae bacterium]|nr:hypothetical protein [Ignavibacteriota bacterium]
MQKESRIQKTDGRWKVEEIRLKPEDEITWSCNDDFAIWFPPGRDPLDATTGNLAKAKQQKRKVKKGVEKGVYEYALFCYGDNTMAEGNSPPKMIIE